MTRFARVYPPGVTRSPPARRAHRRPVIVVFGRLVVTLGSRSVSAYRNIPNRFTSRLIRFSVAPLLNALTSNPVVQVVAVVRPTPHLGVCTFLPDLFAGIVVSLLYQRHR